MSTRFTIILIIILIFIPSCTTSIGLTSIDLANRKVGNGPVSILLQSGKVIDAQNVVVSEDSTQYSIHKTSEIMQISNNEIQSISIIHSGGGALEGFIVGGLAGCGIGLVTFIATPSAGTGLLTLCAMGAGAVGGMLYGLSTGHEYILNYPKDFDNLQKQDSTEVAP